MANLIVVSGPQAVGKMTVAEAIREKNKYALMVNHDSIEVSDKIFGIGTPSQKELNTIIRKNVFDIAVKNNIDMIFTFVTAFNDKTDIDYLKKLERKFKKSGGKFYFVELSADINERLKRNVTPKRLNAKPTKRNLEWSKKDLLETASKYKLNSEKDEYFFENHIKIDNTKLEPEEVASIVINQIYKIENEK